MLVGSFSFLQEFKIFLNYVSIHSVKIKYQKIQKIAEIALIASKIGYLAQCGMFGDISGSKQSQISLLIYYVMLTNCRNKNSTVFQAHTWAKVKL